MLNRFLIALSFLTILPFNSNKWDIQELNKSVIFFPLVGCLEGLLFASSSIIMSKFFSPSFVAVFLLSVMFLIRGIFHIDGLSDTADAFFYKPTGDSAVDMKKRVEIMKDSTVGVGGVTAVVMDLLFRFVLIKEIIEIRSFFCFVAIFCLSRWLIIPVMYYGKPATTKGLGAIFVGKINKKQFILSTILPIFVVIGFSFFKKSVFLPVGFLVVLLFTIFFKKAIEKMFNGITGDHLGAITEISEILLLITFIIKGRIWLNL